MGNEPTASLQVIGLAGSFGSGCTYVAEHVLKDLGYRRVCLSDFLRKETPPSDTAGNVREFLQRCGDEFRLEHGPDYFARQAWQEIESGYRADGSTKWLVDSIRNPAEVHFLRNTSASFFLFGVYASQETRWQRVRQKYNDNRRTFDEDDERDTGRRSADHGQRVEDCFLEADVVVSNDETYSAVGNKLFVDFRGRIQGYVDLISQPLTRRQPTQDECLMAAAYTMSQRSSCLKRKVGAVIVDKEGSVISSGFNEVPARSRPCMDELRKCARTKLWDDFSTVVREYCQCSPEKQKALMERFRRDFKILDNCRSLHAEENAIVNLAKNGRSVPLGECTLFTTTYPCRLCANKIVNLGIRNVVYLEPYPDQEAKVILQQGGVEDRFFQGITFKAYSRIYGEKK